MLKKSAVPVNLWSTLLELQNPLADSGFSLAGGTSLALRFGHRLSTDLDFFCLDPFDPEQLASQLGLNHSSITGQAEGTLQAQHNGIKLEFLRHSYPQLREIEQIDGVRLWSIPDVAAMKINAIVNRGSKKDFYDLATLLDGQALEVLLGYYREKYQPASLLMAIRSLAWFEDAEAEPDPISLTDSSWPEITQRIEAAIRQLK